MDFKPWKTLQTEVLHENPWTSFHHDRFEIPNGKQGDYYYMKTRGSVVIVPLLDDGRLVLHREYRYLFDRVSLEFPSGGIKLDQTPDQAAAAELEEEIGYRSQSLEAVQEVAPANGTYKEYAHIYIATRLQAGASRPDETELFEVVLLSPSDLDQAILKGEIWDGFTIVAWCLCRERVLKHMSNL